VNLAGLPAATLPVRLSSESHLPISLQVSEKFPSKYGREFELN